MKTTVTESERKLIKLLIKGARPEGPPHYHVIQGGNEGKSYEGEQRKCPICKEVREFVLDVKDLLDNLSQDASVMADESGKEFSDVRRVRRSLRRVAKSYRVGEEDGGTL